MYKSDYRHIDLQDLEENTFGDKTMLKMIIELFMDDVDMYIKVLDEDLKNENWSLLFQATHKIKPNISMFGITQLVPDILELESNFRNEQNLNTVEALVNSSVSVLKQVKVELQNELKLIDNE